MTAEVVLAGLTGQGPSISGYMIAPGSVSHSAAIDLDLDDGLPQAMKLGRLMWEQGLPVYVETSRRGAHMWMCLDAVTPARVIRMALRGLLQAAGMDDTDKRIELRPGSDSIADDGLGHALRLPLMPHPKTGKRGSFMDPRTSKPVALRLSEVLLELQAAPSAVLADWAERYEPPPLQQIPREFRPPREPFPEDDMSATDILRELWGVDARPGREVRCPAHQDKNPSLYVFPDDRRAKCHASGCILNNGDKGRGTWELQQLAPAHGR